MSAPSAWQLESAIATFQACRARIQNEDADDTDPAMIGDAQATEDEVRAMLRRVIRAAIEAQAFADACAERMNDLAARRDRFKARADNLRMTAFAVMDALGDRKIVEPEFTASIGKPRLGLVITDETAIPDQYVRTTRTPDKAAIKAAIEQGNVVPGAEVANGMPTFSLRTK